MTDNNGFHQLEPRIATHAKEDTLDLVISSSSLSKQIMESYMEPLFYITSDHEIILIWLELEKSSFKNIGGPNFRLEKIDKKQFIISLEAQKNFIYVELAPTQSPNSGVIRKALDKSAKTIIRAIHSSLELSTEQPKRSEKREL